MMQLQLRSGPNPDYGQTRAPAPPIDMQVETVEEAQKHHSEYIELFDLGGGNCPTVNVRDDSGVYLGRISYNGRWWPKDDDPHLPRSKQ